MRAYRRKLPPLVLSDEQRDQLQAVAHSTAMPHSLVLRARRILACPEGITNAAAAKRFGTSPQAVGKWCRPFLAAAVEGLSDELRPGRPRTCDDEKVAQVIHRALRDKPANATRRMATAEGVSRSTVQGWFCLCGVKPHLSQTCPLSNDPFSIKKVRDIVGLYFNPPAHAAVLSVDEKTLVPALDRTQPIPPPRLGDVEG